MVNKITVLLSVLLTGCMSVPITAKFPEAPDSIKAQCPRLKQLNDSDNLSQISKTITDNYTLYYECATKHSAWVEWYEVQKKIYEGVK